MTTFDDLKISGVEMFGAVGAWAYDEWCRLNESYFDAKNTPGAIDWVSANHNGSLGCYASAENRIFLFKGLVRPRYPTSMAEWCLENLNKRLASDVLLHEMIHQNIYQTGGWEGETSHNNERFVGEVNRIAKLLNLKVTAKVIESNKTDDKTARPAEPGCLTLAEICYFPYSTRPYEYYYGPVP